MFAKLKNWYFIIVLGIITLMYFNINRKIDEFEDRLDLATGTISLQMYESIEHWSDSFNIPKHIAYNVAYLETRYRGPFDFDYNPYQTSFAGAVGPMQIITLDEILDKAKKTEGKNYINIRNFEYQLRINEKLMDLRRNL